MLTHRTFLNPWQFPILDRSITLILTSAKWEEGTSTWPHRSWPGARRIPGTHPLVCTIPDWNVIVEKYIMFKLCSGSIVAMLMRRFFFLSVLWTCNTSLLYLGCKIDPVCVMAFLLQDQNLVEVRLTEWPWGRRQRGDLSPGGATQAAKVKG